MIFFSMDYRQIIVVLADHDRNSASRFGNIIVRRVNNVKIHENFDYASYNNDIAIIEMNEKVHFTSVIQPACILQSGNNNNDYNSFWQIYYTYINLILFVIAKLF